MRPDRARPGAEPGIAAPSPQTNWPVIAAAVGGGIVAALHVGKVPPALPALRVELGISLVQAGFVVSLFNLLGMVLGVAVGSLADRLGRRRLVIAGFVCMVSGGVLGALSTGMAPLLASRFLEGVGFVAASVALPAVIAAAASARHRPMAISLWSIYTPAGMTLALLAAPLVLALADWRALWLGVAAVAAVFGVIVVRAMGAIRMPPAPAGRPIAVIREALGRPALLLLALSFSGYAFQWMSLMVWLPTFLAEEFDAGVGQAALFTALVVAINIPGILLAGWLLGRGAPVRWMIGGAVLVFGVATLGIFPTGLDPVARLGLCLVFSFTGGLVPAALFNSVHRFAPSPGHLAASNGMLMQGSSIGQFLGAPIVAAAVAATGGAWSGAILPMLLAGAVTLGAGWAMDRRTS